MIELEMESLMKEYDFKLNMSVRDYECDLQGIVNNAVYQNYLEHVRHAYLRSVGIDFAEYAARGIWYDALAAVSDEVDAVPHATAPRRRRNALLDQVGLGMAAELVDPKTR